MKDKIISFIWQHFLLLLSLFVMTLGVAVCVRSQLGSSVISTIPYVMECAGKVMDAVPDWTIGTYTIVMRIASCAIWCMKMWASLPATTGFPAAM